MTIPDTVKIDELAAFLGCSPRRIQQLAKAGILPKSEKGLYPFRATVQDRLSAAAATPARAPPAAKSRHAENEIETLFVSLRAGADHIAHEILARFRADFAVTVECCCRGMPVSSGRYGCVTRALLTSFAVAPKAPEPIEKRKAARASAFDLFRCEPAARSNPILDQRNPCLD